MATNVLSELGLTPAQVGELSSKDRSRLLNFLMRWEHVEALHACLDALLRLNPRLVSLLDLRVRAFLAQGRPDEALAVMEQRLDHKTSLTAQSLLARVYLGQADVEAAHLVARRLVEEQEDSALAWGLLAEVELARGNVDAAWSAYRRVNTLRPQSRAYLLGMVTIYQARDDWVTASGYAVRLLRTAAQERELPVTYLRQLRDYFRVSGEETRLADLEAELARRYADELAALKTTLTPTLQKRPAPGMLPPEATGEAASEELLPSFDHVPVSEEEQARILEAARQLFGFEMLLPGQLETIACVLRGEDVLTILPTGGGKSLCYQLPALLEERGLTLVISPLIALMKDQVDSLPASLHPQATTINSSLEGDELRHRLEQTLVGAYRLVYAAPERLRQPPFLHALRRAGLSRLVIDEAHCVSMWGHNFRPDYLIIGRAREALGAPPLLALTATAPSRVRYDILQRLGSSPANPGTAHSAPGGFVTRPEGAPPGSQYGIRLIAGDVTRPNLHLEVFHARNLDEKLGHLLNFCQAESGSGIVYAGTRARCEELAALLRRGGLSAAHYHAGIPDRAGVQDDFMAGRLRVVVATVAFGLGIDKSDIRFIVHFAPPPSPEAYYQEAGRAGRDGLPARCLLMYAPSDRATLTRRARRDVLQIEFLRAVYRAVKSRLKGATAGRIAATDLERDLQADDVRIRVALSLLEEVEVLRRGPDVPRAAVVCLAADKQSPGACSDDSPHALPANSPGHSSPQATEADALARATTGSSEEWAAFCQAARLRPGQALTLDLVDVARRANLPLDQIERQVLEWADAGWLSYRPAGRDLLIELLPTRDASEQVAALLERYETTQAQRVDEIAAYAQTGRCRHGYLNAYLGGRTIERCTACDNCVGSPSAPDSAPEATDGLPDEREQLLAILGCIAAAPWSWGRVNLTRILRGDKQAPPNARNYADFGALAFRSATAIEHMLNRLESGGFLQARTLEHGGVVLDLAPAGRAALQNPAALDELIEPPSQPSPPHPSEGEADLAVDEALFQSLRAWRLEQAREQKVPPYVVFHDSALRAIAAHRPVTLEALSKLKGIGPRKLEQYGQAVLELVQKHLWGTLTTLK